MLILPGSIEKLQTRGDRTWRIDVGTQELSYEQAAELTKLNQEYCFVAFKKDVFKDKEKDILKDLQAELDFNEKSPSQRMRNVLYISWTQDPDGYEDFNKYYLFKMEQIIKHLKSKLA